MTEHIYDVIIIGAGAAGIAAGRKLHDAGKDILIIEARERIGGRIHTSYDFADEPVELGAEFIHGENAVTHELVKQAGLHVIPVDRYGKLRWAQYSRPAVPISALPSQLRATVTGLFMHYRAMPEHMPVPDVSLGQYLREKGWDEEALKVLDETPISKAIAYSRNHREAFCPFLEDGRLHVG